MKNAIFDLKRLIMENPTVQYKALFDMDGTLARFYDDEDCLTNMHNPGYYENLGIHRNMLKTMLQAIKLLGVENVYIISAYIDSPYCQQEKLNWLEKNIPIALPAENILLVPCGIPKTQFIPGGVNASTILFDDYNKNLIEWVAAGGTAIKAINPINHVNGTWKGEVLLCD
jgi:5'(3')-deoxyribonucleotidase